jgi:hypothetical protein
MKAGSRKSRRLRAASVVLVAASALAALGAPSAGAVNIGYSFSSGSEGWVHAQRPTGPFTPPTFNPAGFIQGTDTGVETGCPSNPCELLFFTSPISPAPFAANYGGTLSFDFSSSAPPGFLATAYIDSTTDTNPELRRSFAVAPSGFGRVTLPLTEAGWSYCPVGQPCTPATQQQFQALLAGATFTHILADVVDGTGETYSVDNYALSEKAKPKKKCKKKGKGKKAAAAKKKKCKKKKKGKKGSVAARPSFAAGRAG